LMSFLYHSSWAGIDRSANTSVGILVEDGNDFTMLSIDDTTHSCYGDHLIVADTLVIDITMGLVDSLDTGLLIPPLAPQSTKDCVVELLILEAETR